MFDNKSTFTLLYQIKKIKRKLKQQKTNNIYLIIYLYVLKNKEVNIL